MTDVIKEIEDWLSTEPNQTEAFLMRKENGQFEVTLQYGNRTTVPFTADTIEGALSGAVSKAKRIPSAARDKRDKTTKVDKKPARKTTKVDKPVSMMPGVPTGSSMPGLG